MNTKRVAILALSISALAPTAAAQLELYDVWGSEVARYGEPLVALGDVDLDGVPDWATADPLYDAGPAVDAGRVWIHSGASGALLARITGVAGDLLGHDLAGLDDVDGDGRADLAVMGFAGGVRVDVRSGLDGSLLHTIAPPPGVSTWGGGLFRLDDLTGDGLAELAVPAGGFAPSTPDRVYVHSGADGSVVHVLTTPDNQFGTQFGRSVASAGDLDGDGLAEVLVGAPMYCINCVHVYAGGLFVYRGADGTLLRSHHAGEGTVEELGASVVGVGDADLDGVPDYAAQANYPNEYVRLYSGLDGALLHQYELADDPAQFYIGYGLAATGDVDGDGAPELVVAPADEVDEADLLLVSCAPPYQVVERVPGRFPRLFASAGDLTGDGTPDLLVGEPSFLDSTTGNAGALHVGRVVMVALDDRSVDADRECPPTPNSTGLEARIWYRGSLRLSDGSLELLAWNLPPNQPGLAFHGPEAAEVPFGNGVRCAGGVLTRLPAVDSGPDGIVQVPVPAALAPPPGVTTRVQYWFRDPAAGGATFDLSDAVALLPSP